MHSNTVDFNKFTKSKYELAVLDALTQSHRRKMLIDQTMSMRLYKGYLKEDKNRDISEISEEHNTSVESLSQRRYSENR